MNQDTNTASGAAERHYADRDLIELGDYYVRHVSAMTGEALHAKSEIAAELGWRDREIDRLRAALASTQAQPVAEPSKSAELSDEKAAFFAWRDPYQLPDYWMARIDLVARDAWNAAIAAQTQAAPTESILIDGAAYEVPASVAAELLRLHIDSLQPVPVAPTFPLLAKPHTGMCVDYSGLLGQCQRVLRRADPGNAEMLRQLQDHLRELGQRWYSGDTAAVDEILQLYCIEQEARAALAKTKEGGAA